MIQCPNCSHNELVGALFCSECGVQIFHPQATSTSPIGKSNDLFPSILDQRSFKKPTGRKQLPPYLIKDASISLIVLSTGKVIPLPKQEEIKLGRVSPDQPSEPDIDLTPYHAYEAGVSRIHISISFADNQVMVTDLGSTNGTRINGMRIASHISYPVRSSDVLTLGKLKIQMLIGNQENGA